MRAITHTLRKGVDTVQVGKPTAHAWRTLLACRLAPYASFACCRGHSLLFSFRPSCTFQWLSILPSLPVWCWGRQALVQTRLAVETTSRVEHDPVRVETTFGRGITFRPRAARRQPQTQQDGEAAAGQVHIPPQPGEVGAGGGGAPDAGVLGAVGRLRGAFVEDAEWGGEEGGLQKGGGAVGGESGEMGMAMEGVAGRGRGRRQFRARQRRDGEEEDGGPEGGAGTSGGEGGAADGESMQHD